MKAVHVCYSFLFIFLLSCSIEEEFPIRKPYPIVNTLSPSDNNETGITLRAEIIYDNPNNITQLGFGLIYNGDTSIYYVSNKDHNSFSLRLTYNLNVGEEYTYYGFVVTNNYKVHGSLESFICQGVSNQIINDFYPKEGPDSTVITIVGDHFRTNPKESIVKLKDLVCPILYSSKDTLKVLVPPSSSYGRAALSIEMNGVIVTANEEFVIIGPEILSISDYVGYPGTQIKIFGDNLKANDEQIVVTIGPYQAHIIEATNTSILFELPVPGKNVLEDYIDQLQIKNGLKIVNHDNSLTIQKTWKLIGPIQWYQYTIDAVPYIDKAYFINYSKKKLIQIDPELNNWTEFANYPGQPGTPHPLHVVDNRLYKFYEDICCGSQTANKVLRYDFLSNSWEAMNGIPIEYDYSMTSYVHNNFIYFLKGSGELYKYDPAIDKYYFLGATALTGIRVFSFVLGNEVYAVTPGKTWQFNFQLENWEEIAQNNFTNESLWQIRHMGSFVKNNMAYLMYEEKIFRLIPESGKWLHVSEWPKCVYLGPTFNINEKIYLLDYETWNGCPDRNMYEFIYNPE